MRDSGIRPGIARLLRFVLRSKQSARADADAELDAFIAARVEQLVGRGMPPDDARTQAIASLGAPLEQVRARLQSSTIQRETTMRNDERLDHVVSDLRYAARSLGRAPGFALVVILILAVGIGMSAAMFTVFKTVLADRLPVAAQERVVVMHPLDNSGTHLDVPESYLPQIARDSAVFRGVAGVYHLMAPQPFMNGSSVVVLNFVGTSSNFFDVLGMRPALGRLLVPQDGDDGAPMNMVLSYAAWRREFGGDPAIVGRVLVVPSLQLRATIVGVAPPGFAYPSGADVWRAIPRANSRSQVDIFARLAPGVSIDIARRRVFDLTQRVNPFAGDPTLPASPDKYRISGVEARSFTDTVLGDARPSIVALTAAVAVLLLIACVNVGSLSLVRLLDRMREIAVRRALGASATDIVRLFAIENVVLAAVGGALGFALAVAALKVVGAVAPQQIPRLDALGSLAQPLAAAAIVTIVALLICGIVPSFVAVRAHSYGMLRSDSRSGTESVATRRARQWLVITQIALAVVMLNGAGLLVRTLVRLKSVDLGYTADHLSLLSFTAPVSTLPKDESAGTDLGATWIRRLEAAPGVIAATPVLSEPFIGRSLFILKLARAEQPEADREHNPFVPFEFVGRSYFKAFGTPILRGRGFTDIDTRGSEKVVVVNEALAKQLWPDENAIGKRLALVTSRASDSTFTVVGVARDTRFRELKDVGPVAYFVWDQMGNGFPGRIALRTREPLASALPAIREAMRDINPALVIWKSRTMDQMLDAPMAQPRASAMVLSGFGIVALLLSAIGLYGVMSASVRRQTHEFGVRMALGATPIAIGQLVISQVVGLIGIGVIGGLGIAVASARLLRSVLFEVSAIDSVALLGACGLLVAIATLAAWLPARRATRVDPSVALRAE